MMTGDGGLLQEALKRGSSYAWDERWEEAAREYRSALELSPQDPSAMSGLAMALYRAGHLAESLETYQALLKLQPSNLSILGRIAELQGALGDRESAIAGYRVLAELYARRGDHVEALKAWQKVAEWNPDSSQVWNSLMDAAERAGAATRVMSRFLAAGREMALQGQFEDAFQLAERAQRLDPSNPSVMALLLGIKKALVSSWQAQSMDQETPQADLSALFPPIPIDDEPQPAPRIRPRREPRLPIAPEAPAADLEQAAVAEPLLEPSTQESERIDESGETEVEAEAVDAGPSTEVADQVSTEWAPGATEELPEEPEQAATEGLPEVAEHASTEGEGLLEPAGLEEEQLPEGEAARENGAAEAGAASEIEPVTQSMETESSSQEAPSLEDEPLAGDAETSPKSDASLRDPAAAETGAADERATLDLEETAAPAPAEPESPQAIFAEDAQLEEPAAVDQPAETVEGDTEEATSQAATEDEAAEAPEAGRGWLDRLFGFLGRSGDTGAPVEAAQAESEGEPLASGEAPVSIEPEEGATPYDEVAAEPLVAEGEAPVLETAEVADASEEPVSVEAGDEVPEADREVDVLGVEEVETGDENAETPPIRDELLWQARDARASGMLEDAASLLEEAISAGTSTPWRLVELAEIYLQTGRTEAATGTYKQALQMEPDFSGALLGLARLDLLAEELDPALEKGRLALETAGTETRDGAAELLLEALGMKAAEGQLATVAEALVWLRSSVDVDQLSPAVANSLAAAPVDLLGRTVGEHLEEVVALPEEDREQVIAVLQSAEEHLRHGHFRSAADELYELISVRSDFLPAHSLLGRTLVARGRTDEARERAELLLRLYELGGDQGRGLGVLWWAVVQQVMNGDARSRLVELLRANNRLEEANLVDMGWSEPPAPAPEPVPVAVSSSLSARSAPATVEETAGDQVGQEDSGSDWQDQDSLSPAGLIELAEARAARGDRAGAAQLVAKAADSGDGDEATRAALLRILQVLELDAGGRKDLADILRRLGLPEELANY